MKGCCVWFGVAALALGCGQDSTSVLDPCSAGSASTAACPEQAAAVDAAPDSTQTSPSTRPTPELDAGTRQSTDSTDPRGREDAGDAGDLLLDEGACGLGSLRDGCAADCPPLADAVEALRERQSFGVVARRSCSSSDGTPLVSVGTSIGSASRVVVYDLATGDVLAVQVSSDYSEYCAEQTYKGFYGRYFADCDFRSPAASDDCQAALAHAERDAGLPAACAFVED
jgi:hypothetical protein